MSIRGSKSWRSWRLGVLGAIFLSTTGAFADPTWLLTTTDFQSKSVDLKSIDGSLQVTGDSLPLDKFLSIQRATPETPSPRFLLHLTNGDTIAGSPSALADEKLAWKSDFLGPLTIPLKQIQSITKPTITLSEEKRPTDIIILANGDTMKGIVTSIADNKLNLQGDTDTTPIPVDSIASIAFATNSLSPQPSVLSPSFRVRLTDGSSLTTQSIANFRITLFDGSQKQLDLASIQSIEQLNGPVSFLSTRTPSAIVQIPYLGTPWPTHFDRNVMNQPLTFQGKTFPRGIGVHSYSKITWPLDGTYHLFRTQYAIDGDQPYADVTVRIILDNKIVHEQKNFRSGNISDVLALPLDDAHSLTLEVDFGENHDTQDRFDWLMPALIK